MPRKITLESIIDKIEDKEFFYVSENDVKLDITIETALLLRDANIVSKNDRLSPFKDARSLYELESTQEDIANKYQLDTQRAEQLRELYQLYFSIDTPVLRKQFKHLTKEQLAQLNKQAKNIDFALKLYSPPVNGKDNFCTIVARNKVLYPVHVWRKAMRKAFIENANDINLPEDKQALFAALKEYLLLVFEETKASAKAIEELQALTFKEVTDRHKPRAKIEKNYTQHKSIENMKYCKSFDFISSMSKLEDKTNILNGERVLVWENSEIKATTIIPKELCNLKIGNFNVFTDKLMLLARLIMYKNIGKSYTGEFTVSMTIHETMLALGYTKEEAENADTRHNFMSKKVLPCLALLRYTDIEEKTGEHYTYSILSGYAKREIIKFTFTGAFVRRYLQAHADEYVLRDVLKIPDEKKTAYYMARKLVNIAGNKKNIASDRDDLLSVAKLFDELNAKGVLHPKDKTRNKERKQINTFLEAIEYLKEIGFLNEFVFLNPNKKPVTLKDMEYYKQNIDNLKELMTCFVVSGLSPYVMEHQADIERKVIEQKAKAEENAEKKRAREKRQAQKQAQREQEQEQEQPKEENRSPFYAILDALPKS